MGPCPKPPVLQWCVSMEAIPAQLLVHTVLVRVCSARYQQEQCWFWKREVRLESPNQHQRRGSAGSSWVAGVLVDRCGPVHSAQILTADWSVEHWSNCSSQPENTWSGVQGPTSWPWGESTVQAELRPLWLQSELMNASLTDTFRCLSRGHAGGRTAGHTWTLRWAAVLH